MNAEEIPEEIARLIEMHAMRHQVLQLRLSEKAPQLQEGRTILRRAGLAQSLAQTFAITGVVPVLGIVASMLLENRDMTVMFAGWLAFFWILWALASATAVLAYRRGNHLINSAFDYAIRMEDE